MKTKTYGSAVLTALQAQHKSIEEVEELVNHRRLQAFIRGGSATEWLDCFWQQVAILEANKCRKKIEERNLQTIFSGNARTYKSVTVIVLK